ncbi:hypothetical protein [Thermoactinomyces mirandus]|uniref:Na+-translocating membrane potential-generating system MpsC domain-containing protein n=1 Tax=Thermoactinomyces mirandus TaxID=2756294 RepID=A0A7W1XV83_9BACL|nr:hypothetical protein [Thermoactinomyces mirandus]MBA4603610.1 hypothetical protein [Thermoactinomyces mirandus]
MQINYRQTYQERISNAYREGQYRLFGKKCTDVDVLIYHNHIFIISKDESETSSRITIRGRRIDPALNEMKQIEYDTYMKSTLSQITGCNVVCCQFNIIFSNGLIMDIYCMDGKLDHP